MTDHTAVMICGHGSRDDDAINEFNRLSGHLKKRLPDFDVESGFLEFARPVIRVGLEKLKGRGAKRIVCLPGMLFAGAAWSLPPGGGPTCRLYRFSAVGKAPGIFGVISN